MAKGMTLEERSFINLVNFFRPELEQYLKGAPLLKAIPSKATRQTLYRHGVLSRGFAHKAYEGGGGKIVVTSEALKVLEDE